MKTIDNLTKTCGVIGGVAGVVIPFYLAWNGTYYFLDYFKASLNLSENIQNTTKIISSTSVALCLYQATFPLGMFIASTSYKIVKQGSINLFDSAKYYFGKSFKRKIDFDR